MNSLLVVSIGFGAGCVACAIGEFISFVIKKNK